MTTPTDADARGPQPFALTQALLVLANYETCFTGDDERCVAIQAELDRLYKALADEDAALDERNAQAYGTELVLASQAEQIQELHATIARLRAAAHAVLEDDDDGWERLRAAVEGKG